jgi:hypothetical protein
VSVRGAGVSVRCVLEGDRIRLIGAGAVPSREMEDAFRLALAPPRLRAKLQVLWDLRQVPNLDLTEQHLRTLRRIAGDAGLPFLGARVAWLAGTPVVFGIGCMFRGKAATLPLDVEVFRDEGAALDWLGAHAGGRAVETAGGLPAD